LTSFPGERGYRVRVRGGPVEPMRTSECTAELDERRHDLAEDVALPSRRGDRSHEGWRLPSAGDGGHLRGSSACSLGWRGHTAGYSGSFGFGRRSHLRACSWGRSNGSTAFNRASIRINSESLLGVLSGATFSGVVANSGYRIEFLLAVREDGWCAGLLWQVRPRTERRLARVLVSSSASSMFAPVLGSLK